MKKYSNLFRKTKTETIIFPNLFKELGFTQQETQILQDYITSKDPDILSVDIFQSVFTEYLNAIDLLVKKMQFCDLEKEKNGKKYLLDFFKSLDKKFLTKYKDSLLTVAYYAAIKNNYKCEEENIKNLSFSEKKLEIILFEYYLQIKKYLSFLGWEEKEASKKLIYFLEQYQIIFKKSAPSWPSISRVKDIFLTKKSITYNKIPKHVKNVINHPLFFVPFNPIHFLEKVENKIEK